MLLKNKLRRMISFGIALLMLLPLLVLPAGAQEQEIWVISGSDFQHPNGGSYNKGLYFATPNLVYHWNE